MDRTRLLIWIAALGLLLGVAGCPTTDDDDSSGDDDAGDDDAGDDDAGDDDSGGTDADGDGFTDDVDCDDSDPDVNPDATELCYDKVDNNCDGDVDAADADDCAVNDAEIVVTGDGATLTIPAGAVMGDVTFDIAETTPPRLPGHCTPQSFYFVISATPDDEGNLELAVAGLVAAPEKPGGGAARELMLMRFDGATWTAHAWNVGFKAGTYEAEWWNTGIFVFADCVAAP